MNKTYTVKQVADILGYSTNSIYTFLKEGRIVGIRLGKGRFRIPQEEVDKILLLKKSDTLEQSVLANETVKTTSMDVQEKIPSLDRHLDKIKDNSPSLFDWFVSLMSIIIGFTMIIFVRNLEEFSKVNFFQLLSSIKVNLLAAGIGLFIVNFFHQVRKNWYFIFYLILLINFVAYAVILFLGANLFDFYLFFLLSVMMILHLALNLKGALTFNIFVILLTILSPLILYLVPSAIDLDSIAKLSGQSNGVVVAIWTFLMATINLVILLSQKNKKLSYWVSYFLMSLGLSYFVYLYSLHLYWSRALVYVLIILFLLIASFWVRVSNSQQEYRRIMNKIFSDLVLIFFFLISLIWIIQTNIRDFAKNEMINKLVYGKIFVQTNLSSAKLKLETLAKNQQIIEAMEKGDKDTLDKLIKDIFIYAENYRRILVANEKGDLLTNYPKAEIGYSNISFRDYFKYVKANKVSYIENVYQTLVNGEKKSVISLNTPILDKDDNFIGVIIGSLDIGYMTNKLGQTANLNNGEYFILVDGRNNLIVDPKNIKHITDQEIEILTSSNISNNIEVVESLDKNSRIFQVHDNIENTQWKIVLRRTLESTYSFDNKTYVLIEVIILIVGFVLIISNIIHLRE